MYYRCFKCDEAVDTDMYDEVQSAMRCVQQTFGIAEGTGVRQLLLQVNKYMIV